MVEVSYIPGGFGQCDFRPTHAHARIKLSSITVSTPKVISVSITRTRGQLVSTATASFHLDSDSLTALESDAGGHISIALANTTAFTGTITRIDASPSFRCAGELIIRIQAKDFLHRLENKNITRRQKTSGLGVLAMVVGLHKRQSVGFDDPRELHDIHRTGSPIDIHTHSINVEEQTQWLKGGVTNTVGALHPVTKAADVVTEARGGTGGGSFILHDHSELELSGPHAGGPAVGVFGVE